MMPVIAQQIPMSMMILTNATRVLAERCVEGTRPTRRSRILARAQPRLVTPRAEIGYAEAAKLAKEAVAKNVTVRQGDGEGTVGKERARRSPRFAGDDGAGGRESARSSDSHNGDDA